MRAKKIQTCIYLYTSSDGLGMLTRPDIASGPRLASSAQLTEGAAMSKSNLGPRLPKGIPSIMYS